MTSSFNDPNDRRLPLVLKLAVYVWLSYFFYQAVTTFYEYRPGQSWPLMLSIIRTFTFLPIHEAGHFIFILFGKTLYILGGSFWQIMFPLLWFIIAFNRRSAVAPFALFWVGENMMDISLYMRDAPVRQLPLLGGHKSGHDWYNLFSEWNLLDSAGTFANIFYFLGAIICIGAIAAGVYLSFRSFLRPQAQAIDASPSAVVELEDSLSEMLEKHRSAEL
jgi:hypothetical protein